MIAAELRDWCLSFPGAEETFPFGAETAVFKVAGKMFALAQLDAEVLKVSVKCEPELGERLRASYEAIVPGYHLNKKHWLTVTFGGDAGDAMVRDLIQDSFDLVAPFRR